MEANALYNTHELCSKPSYNEGDINGDEEPYNKIAAIHLILSTHTRERCPLCCLLLLLVAGVSGFGVVGFVIMYSGALSNSVIVIVCGIDIIHNNYFLL